MSSNEFEAAVKFTASGGDGPSLSQTQQLMFYALFKQATKGTQRGKRPGRMQIVKRAKWDAWNKLGNMSQQEARQQYVDMMTKVAPQWRQKAGLAQSAL
ncbi:MAG: hypothetical protein MHM6MM_003715 [Cercozoa sp. M6MM]